MYVYINYRNNSLTNAKYKTSPKYPDHLTLFNFSICTESLNLQKTA